MARIPDDMAASYGVILEEFEASIDVLNSSKADTLADLRADLKALGMTGAEITAEIAALKGAVKLQRMTEADRQKAEAKEEGVADYANIMALARARAHTREDNQSTAARKDGQATDGFRPLSNTDRERLAGDGLSSPSMRQAGTQALPVDTHTEPQPQAAQTVPAISPVASASAEQASVESSATHSEASGSDTSDPLRSDGAEGNEAHLEASEAHTPPVAPPPVADPATGVTVESDRSEAFPPADAPVASNITVLRTHNRDTHFLNSKGLPRLNGCQEPEKCAGSRSKLCFSCSVRNEGPAHSESGVA